MIDSAYPENRIRFHANEAATLRTLNAFALDLMTIRSVQDLYWYVARNVVGRLNFLDCVIYQANDSQDQLIQVAAGGEKNPFGHTILNSLTIPFGKGITGKVAQSQKAIIVNDLLTNENYIPDIEPARSEICVPLISHGRVVGAIDCEHPEANAFGEPEMEILTTVAAMLSAKIELLAETQRSTQRYQDLVRSLSQLSLEEDIRRNLEEKLFEASKFETIGRLTGKFAHEFNNMLTVIAGNLELIELNLNLPRSLSDAKAAAQRGAKVIRDMMFFAQRSHLVPTTFSLNDLIVGVTTRVGEVYAGKVQSRLPADLWPVWVDRAGLENAFINLLINAAEATPGGGRIHVFAENVTHQLSDDQFPAVELLPGRYVRLSVTDFGKGISKSQLALIFDPFYTTKPAGSGVGLGLSMVHGFLQKTGGAVSVISEVGIGSSFQMYIPTAVNGSGHDYKIS